MTSIARRLGAAVLAVVVLVGLVAVGAPATARTAPTKPRPAPATARAAPVQPCNERSWTGGATEWCHGTFVYRDYVYDDYGADSGGDSPHGTGLFRPKGDVDHRKHGQSLNSADLLALRLSRHGRDLVVRAELNTLLPKDTTFLAIALDTDLDRTTGGGPWPGMPVTSAGWEEVRRITARDVVANVIEGRIPLPRGDFAVHAVVSLGDGIPMNVAFRPSESGNWWDDQQATVLAGRDISAFRQVVAAKDLGRRHEPAAPPGPGYHERMVRSAYSLGEGVTYEGVAGPTTATFHFLGPVQPYALFVPRGRAPHQAMLLLHGSGSAHSAVIQSPKTQEILGTQLNRILISPLSRGFNNSYVDEGATDALDALADVEAHWPVDPDRVFVSGYSMGGGGALQLSTWFPDRWAGVIEWVGFTGDCLNGTPLAQGRQRVGGATALSGVHYHFSNDASKRSGCQLGARGNAGDYLENLRHVPSAHLFAGADELVWANHGAYMAKRLEDARVPHRFWFHPAAEHFTFALLGDWRKEAAYTRNLRRERRPATVVYRTNSFLYVPRLGLLPDGAYWVDAIRPRNTTATPEGDAVVELTSHACARSGAAEFKISTDAGIDPVPWVGREGAFGPAASPATRRAISGRLVNVASLTIRLDDACLGGPGPVDLSGITTDGPVTISFGPGRAPVTLR